ncbi:MAG: response regulator [Anaerolineae bacterium]
MNPSAALHFDWAQYKRPGSGHRILIVDDDENICRSLRLIFKKKGYEVETAGTGREALEKAQERFFNLALLDIRLPDTAGIELLAPLKELHPDMAVILVTGYASLETAVQALHEGALAYITKPLNMDEVLATVREALEKQRLVIENRRLYQEAQRELAERKRAEEALKEYSERLEEMVGQRTKELRDAQEQLIRAERLAAISQLGASVCHELGNPLGVINNSVYYLSTMLGDVDGKAKKHLKIMKREIARAKKITSDLLSLTEGKKLTLQKIQVNTIVQGALSHTPAPDTVTVITDLGGDLPPVMADPDQIEQVFTNLILNAVQAMTSSSPRPENFGEPFGSAQDRPGRAARPEVSDEPRSRMSSVEPLSQSVKTPDLSAEQAGGGRLEIATRVEDGLIVAEFKDNGYGIPEENLEKIFEPLFTTKARGIGLGLALSKKIIEAHGGSIEVEREAEKGTTFRVKFPNVAQPVTEYRGEAWLIKVAS